MNGTYAVLGTLEPTGDFCDLSNQSYFRRINFTTDQPVQKYLGSKDGKSASELYFKFNQKKNPQQRSAQNDTSFYFQEVVFSLETFYVIPPKSVNKVLPAEFPIFAIVGGIVGLVVIVVIIVVVVYVVKKNSNKEQAREIELDIIEETFDPQSKANNRKSIVSYNSAYQHTWNIMPSKLQTTD
jgi:hypothetical protein